MLFRNSQLIAVLVLILTVYKIHSARRFSEYRSPTKRNFKFGTTTNRRYRKLSNPEASIDVGNVISIVIPNNPHEMLNVDQLTEDFRSELERIKKQSSVNKFQHGLTTLRKVLPELSPEEKRRALPWLRRILRMKKLEEKYPTNKNRRHQDTSSSNSNSNSDNKENEELRKRKQQVGKRKDDLIGTENGERKYVSEELDSEEPEVGITELPHEETEISSTTQIVTQSSTSQTYVTQDYNSPLMTNFATTADCMVNHNFPAISALKNAGPVGLFKAINVPMYTRIDKRHNDIGKDAHILKSTIPNENLEIVAARDAAKDVNFNRNARLVNDLARIAEQLASLRTNRNPSAVAYLDQLTSPARHDFAAAQPLNSNSSEDLQSNASLVVTNGPKRVPEVSADLIVYDFLPDKNTDDKRNNYYLRS